MTPEPDTEEPTTKYEIVFTASGTVGQGTAPAAPSEGDQ